MLFTLTGVAVGGDMALAASGECTSFVAMGVRQREGTALVASGVEVLGAFIFLTLL